MATSDIVNSLVEHFATNDRRYDVEIEARPWHVGNGEREREIQFLPVKPRCPGVKKKSYNICTVIFISGSFHFIRNRANGGYTVFEYYGKDYIVSHNEGVELLLTDNAVSQIRKMIKKMWYDRCMMCQKRYTWMTGSNPEGLDYVEIIDRKDYPVNYRLSERYTRCHESCAAKARSCTQPNCQAIEVDNEGIFDCHECLRQICGIHVTECIRCRKIICFDHKDEYGNSSCLSCTIEKMCNWYILNQKTCFNCHASDELKIRFADCGTIRCIYREDNKNHLCPECSRKHEGVCRLCLYESAGCCATCGVFEEWLGRCDACSRTICESHMLICDCEYSCSVCTNCAVPVTVYMLPECAANTIA